MTGDRHLRLSFGWGMARGTLLLVLLVFSVSCARSQNPRLTEPGVVQIESPAPVEPPADTVVPIPPPIPLFQLPASYKEIRVRLFPLLSTPPQDPYPVTKNRYLAQLFNSGGLLVQSVATGKVIGTYNTVLMDVAQKRLVLDKGQIPLEAVLVVPQNTAITTTLRYDGGAVKLEYRGSFTIMDTNVDVIGTGGVILDQEQSWSIINNISIEEYLYAVVPSEMPAYFEDEALKAQAIAARTYAVFHSLISRVNYKRSWDVDPTTWFQSYRGALVENSKVTPNVVATTGEVLTHNNMLIEAFFSSNSGGTLCSISECFGMSDRAYITTKADVLGVRQKPGGTWTSQVSPSGVYSRLQKLENEGRILIQALLPGALGPQDIQGLEPLEVGAAGRVKRLSIVRNNGQRATLNEELSKEMRWQFKKKTAYYELGIVKNGIQDVAGYGLGHGVGMSQWGAKVMAEQGVGYEDILKFYYEGVEILEL